ncbi:hypothetical protein [Kluyvera sichuanensis]|uniref:hypothetical protein n=1 Tax=Kluyvera sichuanensis TaxID=2725494 RepID=UPI0034A3C217
MKNITLTEFNGSFVKFRSHIGNGVAIWCGDESPPEFCYESELDIDDSFQWGVNIHYVNESNISIETVDDKVFFTAKVLSCEKDGILTISLDGDVIFIEVSLTSIIDGYVLFFTTPNKIKLYPVAL